MLARFGARWLRSVCLRGGTVAGSIRLNYTDFKQPAENVEYGIVKQDNLKLFPSINVKTLLSEQELDAGVRKLADSINETYDGSPLTIIAIMTGSIVMLADLIRLLKMPLRVGVVQARSYEGTQRGDLRINADLMPDIRDRQVLLIDDIFDTGHTLKRVVELMQEMNPTSMRSAVLLRKTGRQEVATEPDFVAFEIPDEFVVGYGLDYEDEYRNLPFLACLQPEDLAATKNENQ